MCVYIIPSQRARSHTFVRCFVPSLVFFMCLFVRSLACPSSRFSVHPSVRLSVFRPHVCSLVRPSVYLFFHSFIRWFICFSSFFSIVCSFITSLIGSFISPSFFPHVSLICCSSCLCKIVYSLLFA